MDTLRQDLRFAVRMLAKNPGFTAVAILCIAFGIGTNVTAFSVISAVLLRPFPYAEPESLVYLRMINPRKGLEADSVSYLDWRDFREQVRSFSQVEAYGIRSLVVSGGDEPERLSGVAVSAGLFRMIGETPALGRDVREDEDRPGAPAVVLLGHDLWKRRFEGDPRIIGKTVMINATAHTVIGVMKPRFGFPEKQEAWIPLVPQAHSLPRHERRHAVLARLAPGVSRAKAAAEVATVAKRLASLHPDTNQGWGARLSTLREVSLEGDTRLVMLIIQAAVIFVLLSRPRPHRAPAPDREPPRGPGGRCTRRRLRALGDPLDGGLDSSGVHAAVLDALHGRRPGPSVYVRGDRADRHPLRAGSGAPGGAAGFPRHAQGGRPRRRRERAPQPAAQRAGGGGDRARPDAPRRHVALPAQLSQAAERGRGLLDGASPDDERLSPRSGLRGGGVQGAAGGRPDPPPRSAPRRRVRGRIDHDRALRRGERGEPRAPGPAFVRGEEPPLDWTGVSPGFFRVLGLPIVRGRALTEREGMERSAVALVNETFAKQFFPNAEVLGQRFRIQEEREMGWITIVGVVPDFRVFGASSRRMLPVAYLPFPYLALRAVGLTIHTRHDPAQVTSQVRKEIRASDPELPVYRVLTMEQVRQQNFWQYRVLGGMLAAFGAIALFLAAIGVYGVLSYSVSQQVREIGVRMALGAKRSDVLRLVVGQGVSLALAGVGIGLVLAFGAGRVVASALFDVSPSDPVSFAAIAVLLIAVASCASFLPANRATEVDPLEALRNE